MLMSRRRRHSRFGAASAAALRLVPAALTLSALEAAVLVGAPAPARAQGSTIGSLSVTRQVQVSRAAVASGGTPEYIPATQGQGVFAGQGVRTLKRSQAQIAFTDGSMLRVGERTDLVVQDTGTLRNIRLQRGVVWLKVAKGVNTQVETPSATAVARGTVFTVDTRADGATRLTVYESSVDLNISGQTLTVNAGETVLLRPTEVPGRYTLPQAATQVPKGDLPVENGGASKGWWSDVAENGGQTSAPGSSALQDLRMSPLTEAVQQLAGTSQGLLLADQERARLLSIAQRNLVPSVVQSGLSPSNYANQFGSQGLTARIPALGGEDLSFLQGLGIGNIGDFFNYVNANGAAADIGIDLSRSRGRQIYRDGSVQGQPNFDFRLLDRTETSDTILGIGALATLAANLIGKTGLQPSIPRGEVMAFGFYNDPASVNGGRASLTGTFGKTRYRYEGNVLRLLEGVGTDTYSKFASVAVLEHPIGDSVTLFAGRRRFYHGPVFQNQVLSQLISDRYSGAGLTARRGPMTFEGAYVFDANPVVRGVQEGALGSLFYSAFGGKFGVHYLRVPKVSDGNGATFSLSMPVLPRQVDFYGEVGKGVDGASLQTYGIYLPGLYQKTDVDFFVEYGSHEGVGHALSLIASRNAGPNLNFRLYGSFEDGGKDVVGGLAAILRFGTK